VRRVHAIEEVGVSLNGYGRGDEARGKSDEEAFTLERRTLKR